jgi:hypothetical protein
MEHRGIEYSVVQTASPTGWKWTARFPGRKPKTGHAFSRDRAIMAAKSAIDKAVKVKPTDEPNDLPAGA